MGPTKLSHERTGHTTRLKSPHKLGPPGIPVHPLHQYVRKNALPDPADWPWNFETRSDSVGVWFLAGWDGYDQDALKAVSEHYDRRTNEHDISGTVAVFSEDTDLPKETQEYISEEWGDNADGVDRVAFASEGIKAMAVSSNVDVSDPGVEVEWFSDVDDAVEWAAGA